MRRTGRVAIDSERASIDERGSQRGESSEVRFQQPRFVYSCCEGSMATEDRRPQTIDRSAWQRHSISALLLFVDSFDVLWYRVFRRAADSWHMFLARRRYITETLPLPFRVM